MLNNEFIFFSPVRTFANFYLHTRDHKSYAIFFRKKNELIT